MGRSIVSVNMHARHFKWLMLKNKQRRWGEAEPGEESLVLFLKLLPASKNITYQVCSECDFAIMSSNAPYMCTRLTEETLKSRSRVFQAAVRCPPAQR